MSGNRSCHITLQTGLAAPSRFGMSFCDGCHLYTGPSATSYYTPPPFFEQYPSLNLQSIPIQSLWSSDIILPAASDCACSRVETCYARSGHLDAFDLITNTAV
jgi:hypothetical protein